MQSASDTQRTVLLAEAAADSTGSRWAIAVGQARQDEAGRCYVEVVFRLPDGRLEDRRMALRGTDASARSGLTTQLLDRFRRMLR